MKAICSTRRSAWLLTLSAALTGCGEGDERGETATERAVAALTPTNTRSHDFSVAPFGWVSYRSRPEGAIPCATVTQDFGYRTSGSGEIGGRVTSASKRASYAMPVAPMRSLEQPLTVSGHFRIPSGGIRNNPWGGAVYLGWFNHAESYGWRAPSSLMFRFVGERDPVSGKPFARIFVDYTTHTEQAGGKRYDDDKTGAQHQFWPDVTYDFTLSYNPDAAGGNGEIIFSVQGKGNRIRLQLAPGHRSAGASFDRFGIIPQLGSPRAPMEIYFDNLSFDGGAPLTFASDPRWLGENNGTTLTDCYIHDRFDFGWDAATKTMGGLIWRSETTLPEPRAYYADVLPSTPRPLSLEDELYAEGTVTLREAQSDSGFLFGWFNHDDSIMEKKAKLPTQFLGMVSGGPSRDGQYLRPGTRAKGEESAILDTGPLFRIRRAGAGEAFKLHYVPDTGEPKGGTLTLSLGSVPPMYAQEQTIRVPPAIRAQGATFDRFGLRNLEVGGHEQVVYFDDLVYTYKP